jgi:hypothetical protein
MPVVRLDGVQLETTGTAESSGGSLGPITPPRRGIAPLAKQDSLSEDNNRNSRRSNRQRKKAYKAAMERAHDYAHGAAQKRKELHFEAL